MCPASMVALVNFSQRENAPSPILVTVAGNANVLKPVALNA